MSTSPLEKQTDNPCVDCVIQQDCCTNLERLKLTRIEYQKHFHKFEDSLKLKKFNNIIILSSYKNTPCPNWNKYCTIYENRPIECRLFPYSTVIIHIRKDRVFVFIHSINNCPKKEELLIPKRDVINLISIFCAQAFEGKVIVQPVIVQPVINKIVSNLLLYIKKLK